jgi:hypothetical protein
VKVDTQVSFRQPHLTEGKPYTNLIVYETPQSLLMYPKAVTVVQTYVLTYYRNHYSFCSAKS